MLYERALGREVDRVMLFYCFIYVKSGAHLALCTWTLWKSILCKVSALLTITILQDDGCGNLE